MALGRDDAFPALCSMPKVVFDMVLNGQGSHLYTTSHHGRGCSPVSSRSGESCQGTSYR